MLKFQGTPRSKRASAKELEELKESIKRVVETQEKFQDTQEQCFLFNLILNYNNLSLEMYYI